MAQVRLKGREHLVHAGAGDVERPGCTATLNQPENDVRHRAIGDAVEGLQLLDGDGIDFAEAGLVNLNRRT